MILAGINMICDLLRQPESSKGGILKQGRRSQVRVMARHVVNPVMVNPVTSHPLVKARVKTRNLDPVINGRAALPRLSKAQLLV